MLNVKTGNSINPNAAAAGKEAAAMVKENRYENGICLQWSPV